ncbi:unnamed protein product [Calicophoron daubneyi]|uniref:Uncharacterized protein n=1 Tax=Calicophoron daubneyi TaxID=300641 RepID=A0AAV2TYY6_CALDB
MAKKKDKDFQKVKIKIGRKLKRQNETVIDLTRKKIRLPREREVDEEEFSRRSGREIVTEAIERLALERSGIQLQAVQSLNRILDPFIKQLATLDHPEFLRTTVQSRHLEQLFNLYQAVFHSSSESQLGLSLGSLLCSLSSICRSVTDPKLYTALLQLFTALIKFTSMFPQLPDLLDALERIAVDLLQRLEATWQWLGCRLSGLVFQSRCEYLVTAMLVSVKPQRRTKTRLVDPIRLMCYSSIFSRAFYRLFENLKENQALEDVSNQRTYLLRTILAFFKDSQYSVYWVYHSDHPFIESLPFWPRDPVGSAVYTPCHGFNLATLMSSPPVFNCSDSSVINMAMTNLLPDCHSLGITSSSRAYSRNNSKTAKTPNSDPVTGMPLSSSRACGISSREYQALLRCVLEEGTVLLGEICTSIGKTTLTCLYCVIRILRVALESRMLDFRPRGSEENGDSLRYSELYNVFLRFITKLYTVVPVSLPDEEENSTTKGIPSLESPLVGLSRRQARRLKSRSAKLKIRGKSRLAEKILSHAQRVGPAQNAATLAPLVHRVNQAVVELFACLEWYHQPRMSDDSRAMRLPLPPRETQARMAKLFLHVLTQDNKESNLSLTVLTSWLRAFDIYLFFPVRRWRSSQLIRSGLFTAPLVVCLWRLLSRLWRSYSTTLPDRSLTRTQCRLLGRVIGILTGFLSFDLHGFQSSVKPSPGTESASTSEVLLVASEDSHAVASEYDEVWIWQRLEDLKLTQESLGHLSQSIFSDLVDILVRLIHVSPPRILFATAPASQSLASLREEMEQTDSKRANCLPVQLIDNTWISCLDVLISLNFVHAVQALKNDAAVREKLDLSRRLTGSLIPLEECCKMLNISVPSEVGNHLGCLVSGYLPSTNCRYVSPLFWRTCKDNRADSCYFEL